MDIYLAPPASDIELNQEVEQLSFCIDRSKTGFKHPLPSLAQQGKVNLIPAIWRSTMAPWFNEGNEQMHLNSTGAQTSEELGMDSYFQTALFRIVYEGAPAEPWFDLLPILFTAFTVQIQWLVTQPDNCVSLNELFC